MRRSLRGGFLILPLLLAVAIAFLARPYPELECFERLPFSVELTDRAGRALTVLPLPDGTWREYAALAQIPELLTRVFVASEDRIFYAHFGVDPGAILRAARDNLASGEVVSGGSTITMQLASIVEPTPAGLAGKLTEAIRAIRLELRLSKQRTLELWLNSLPFGSGATGVVSAAKRYFGRPPAELSVEEILLLAVIPRRPAAFDPTRHPEAAAAAAAALAVRIEVATSESELLAAARAAVDRAAEGTDRARYPRAQLAPHFTRFIASQLTEDELAAGIPIETTLDLEVQEAAEAALRARISAAERNRISNGAALVVDNRNGAIVAYVGSADFFDTSRDGQVDGVQIRRQPGSTVKPFLYTLALENGFTPATILPDIESEFGGAEIYVPQNFNRRFNGPVRLRVALASSLNVPAVHMLERLGVQAFADFLITLGFDSISDMRDEVGIGLALGNAEVRLWELVRAFSLFPRDGVPLELRWRETDSAASGDVNRASISPYAAGAIRSVLSDTVGRVAGFGTRSVLDAPFEAMFKTGTSNQFNNIWALGASADLTVGVWMGNFSGETVVGTPGSSLPAAAAVEILGLFTEPYSPLPPVADSHQVEICAVSGMAATEHCHATLTEHFRLGTAPARCDWHQPGERLVRYPPLYQSWALDRRFKVASGDAAAPGPTGGVEILHPADGALFYDDPRIPPVDQAVRVEVVGSDPIQLWVNDAFLAEGPSPLRYYLQIGRGNYRVEALSPAGSDVIAFTVQ